jgi:DNA primase
MSLGSILSNIFGVVKNDGNSQVQVNCTWCAELYNGGEPDDKFNLEISLNRKKYKCWKCENFGSLTNLVRKFGSKQDYSLYKEYEFIFDDGEEKQIKRVYLPREFISFKDGYNEYDFEHLEAFNYVKSRGITWEQITKYNIGFCLKGYYKGRILFPSMNEEEECDFFTARSFVGEKPTYKMPKYPKELIIFNEYYIDWKKPICLVEGIIDALAVGQNTIPLMGKKIHKKLYDLLIENKSIVIVILDIDAQYDMYKILELLHTLGLNDRLFYYDLKDSKDLGEIKQLEGSDGIKKVLSKLKKFNPDDFQDMVFYHDCQMEEMKKFTRKKYKQR